MDGLRLLLRYAAASLRGQMQYPAAFLLLAAAQFFNTLIGFVGVWALFARFGHVGGWRLGEVALFYGVIVMAFALADMISRGFDVFGAEFVKNGEFDRVLLRPRATSLQVAGHELRLAPIGRLAQGVLVFAIGVWLTPKSWSSADVAIVAFAIGGGVAIFYGLLILQATLAFWTVESLEVANIVTYGGMEAGQYPLDVYAGWFRNVMLFVVPIGCVSYLPLTAVLGRPNSVGAPAWVCAASPLVGWAFLGLSLWVWGFGVRRYASTGS
jgi:ABC-2 type transport system permease protein